MYYRIMSIFSCLPLPVRCTYLQQADVGRGLCQNPGGPTGEGGMNVLGWVRIQGLGQNDGFGLQARWRVVQQPQKSEIAIP